MRPAAVVLVSLVFLGQSSARQEQSLCGTYRDLAQDEQATIEGFDFHASPKLPAAQIRDLTALRWLHSGESVLLHGPVGSSKDGI